MVYVQSGSAYAPALSDALLVLLSHVESRCLTTLRLFVVLAESSSRGRGLHLDKCPSDANLDAGFMAKFHLVLARDVFAGLPAGGVTIGLALDIQTSLSTAATLSKVSSIFECYFTPCSLRDCHAASSGSS